MIDAISRAPLADATVMLAGAAVPITAETNRGRGRGSEMQVKTGADGRFELKGLGRGTLMIYSTLTP